MDRNDASPGDDPVAGDAGGPTGGGAVLTLTHPCPDATGSPAAGPSAAPLEGPGFEDWTDAWGIPPLFGPVLTAADVDGDGLPDLWVPTPGSLARRADEAPGSLHGSRLLMNCGDRFEAFDLEALHRREATFRPASASGVADVDGDGRLDLLAGHDGGVMALVQEAPLTFRRRELLVPPTERCGGMVCAPITGLTAADLDGDGDPDLVVARLKADGFLIDDRRASANQILENVGDGVFVDRTADLDPPLRAARAGTYTAHLVRRPHRLDHWLLYFGNDGGPDTVYIQAEGLRFGVVDEEHPPGTTMGTDHTHLDGGALTLIAVSATGPYPLWGVTADDQLVDRNGAVTPARRHNHWGVVFADFDNDGLEDLAYAAGVPDIGAHPAAWGHTADDARLLLLHGERDGDEPHWRDRSEEAGAAFRAGEQAHWYGLVHADFDRDGCVDLAAAPIGRRAPGSQEGPTFDRSVRVLRNRCAYRGGWIGWRLPPRAGALVAATIRLPDGSELVRWREVKASSSVGGHSDTAAIHLGLEPGASVTAAVVHCPDGTEQAIPEAMLAPTAWHDVRDVCP